MQRRPQPGSLVVLRTDYTDAELRLWGCDDCSMNADLLRYGTNIACYRLSGDEREECEAIAKERRPAVMLNEPIVKGDVGWNIRASCHVMSWLGAAGPSSMVIGSPTPYAMKTRVNVRVPVASSRGFRVSRHAGHRVPLKREPLGHQNLASSLTSSEGIRSTAQRVHS